MSQNHKTHIPTILLCDREQILILSPLLQQQRCEGEKAFKQEEEIREAQLLDSRKSRIENYTRVKLQLQTQCLCLVLFLLDQQQRLFLLLSVLLRLPLVYLEQLEASLLVTHLQRLPLIGVAEERFGEVLLVEESEAIALRQIRFCHLLQSATKLLKVWLWVLKND
jgi:hypothetical protein